MQSQYVSFLVTNEEFFETLSRYIPNEEALLAPLRRALPEDWRIHRSDLWFNCTPPPSTALPSQGWKIHVSARIDQALDVLLKTASVLVEESTAFKFAVDRFMLQWLNSKNCPRGHAAKFITVYPRDDVQFRRLVERLHAATAGLEGPHILSDRRFADSKVVHYRYGGVKPPSRCDVRGRMIGFLTTPSGDYVEDQRDAFVIIPEWTQDPFGEPEPHVGEITLNNGRYEVTQVLTSKTSGGVYVATDRHTGASVVIKEARPNVGGVPGQSDAVALLQKEFRLLQRVSDLGVPVRPVELFQDWENWFLVEERIEGVKLGSHAARARILDLNSHTLDEMQQALALYYRIFAILARTIDAIHARGIVLADLSPNNVLVVGDDTLRLIDFEAAYAMGEDAPTDLYTQGFAPLRAALGIERPSAARDRYAFGALMLSYIAMMAPLIALKERAASEMLAEVASDIPLPQAICSLIVRLLDPDPAARPLLGEAAAVLERVAAAPPQRHTAPRPVATMPLATMLHDATRYILSVPDFARRDRLFPAHADVFKTNPLSVAYGACGVAYVLQRVLGACPADVKAWILSQPLDLRTYPPGLYVGLSGIAWTLLDIGCRAEAEFVLGAAARHQAAHESPSVMFGSAGWGLANLHFYQATGDPAYLERACDAGEHIRASGLQDAASAVWLDRDQAAIGLAHGRSGAALFLLYLASATGDDSWLETGTAALEFDLSYGRMLPDGSMSWPRHVGNYLVVAPYWNYGTAGVTTALARYALYTQNDRYRALLDRAVKDVEHKYTAYPGQFNGLAGLGCTLLDLHQLTGDDAYRRRAEQVADGIRLFALPKTQGLAFPGDRVLRISCDYATGSAGIMFFLHRLLTGAGPAFMLDDLIATRVRAAA